MPHVLLTFIFDTPVSSSSIEMDFFNCPQWGISAEFIYVYSANNTDLVSRIPWPQDGMFNIQDPSCESLTTATVTFNSSPTNVTWYIVAGFDEDSPIQWVHIGEVRFNISQTFYSTPCPTVSLSSSFTIISQASASKRISIDSSFIPYTPGTTISSRTSIIADFIYKTSTNNKAENKVNAAFILPFVIAAFVLLTFFVVSILVLLFIKRWYRTKCNHIKQPPEIHNQNNPCQEVIPLEINNPTYSHRKITAPPAVGTGIYSEVTTEKMYSAEKDKITTNTASDGQVFTGMYNLVAPLTPPVKSASEIIESAAYACVQVHSDEVYATPGELDSKKQKTSAQPQPQVSVHEGMAYAALSDATEGEPIECPQMYADIQVREVPAVPTKSSDLQEYLDTNAALNVSIHSEPINPSDFTCNRKKDGGNDPQFLGPIYPLASALPESYQDPAEVTSGNVTEKKKLGTGQFGEVVLANTNGLSLKTMSLSKTDDNPNISILVAVKKLQSNPSQTQREVFDKEVKFMSHIKYPNILRLLGVCHSDPTFIMMEYTNGGDLNQFLQSYSEIVTTSSSQTQITPSELVYIASQISSGMQYLASLKFVHRDLATRNCFVTTNNSIKVGDYGANMSLYQSRYYRIRGNRVMPIRWMATECFSGKFSEKSDVWAFGVTMWELFTLANDVPYPHLYDEEVIHNSLKREYRQFPVKPAACPQPVYEVMEKCWATDMRHRPTFQDILTELRNF